MASRSEKSPFWSALPVAALVAALLSPSCAPGFDPPSKVNTLRILAVTVDKPYALPGEDVTFRMTAFDGRAESAGQLVQIVWLGGCFDPEGDQFALCFEQLAEALAPLASGGTPPPEILELDVGVADGTPDAFEFTIQLPEDIVTRRPPPPAGPHYGIAYVFFAVCAGTIAPAPLTEAPSGAIPEFPLVCLDSEDSELGSESFVIGYTQVYSFGDGRLNANPPIVDLTVDDIAASADLMMPTPVERCPVSEQDRRTSSCADPAEDCRKYRVRANVGDVAEVDPDGMDADGNILREVVWVSYFSDGGDMSPSLSLVSDAIEGYQEEFHSEWTPPAEPGVYRLWAVVRDQRGGSSVVQRFVEVR
jgi:hypothetical protein